MKDHVTLKTKVIAANKSANCTVPLRHDGDTKMYCMVGMTYIRSQTKHAVCVCVCVCVCARARAL